MTTPALPTRAATAGWRSPFRFLRRLVACLAAMVVLGAGLGVAPASGASVAPTPAAQAWLTTADGTTSLLARQPDIPIQPTSGGGTTVQIDPTTRYQTMDGFGAALTDSSAYLLNSVLSPSQRAAALQDLFDPVTGAGISYVRLAVGSNDFSLSNYTYDDMPSGQSDPNLANFSISHDLTNIIPVLKAAKAINPQLKVMATPWSAPAWMKTSGSLIGGTLSPADYPVYAQYFVKFVQAYAAQGITIDAITVQNEPGFSPGGYPGMTLTADQEASFVKNNLGPAFAAAHLSTLIIGFDHNWNTPAGGSSTDSTQSYPLALLSDAGARAYLAGTAFHCYGGDPSAQVPVHNQYPDKGIYFTECTGLVGSGFSGDLRWSAEHLFIGGTNDWAKTVLLWNLALDQKSGPTNGGCSNCRGVVTVNTTSGTVTRNPEYYGIGQLAKFVAPGATRIGSASSSLESVAFQNVDGSTALVLFNPSQDATTFTVNTGQGYITTSIPAGAEMTLKWPVWSSWASLGAPPGGMVGGADVASSGAGRLDAFARGNDGNLWQRSYSNGAWGGWTSLGTPSVAGAATAPVAPALGAVPALGPVTSLMAPALGAVTSVAAPLTPVGLASDPSAVSSGANSLDVFVRGNDGNLWQRSYRGSWGNWAPIVAPGGPAGMVGNPDAASWGPGRLDVVIRGTDGNLWQPWYDGAWHWSSLGAPPVGLGSNPSDVSWSYGNLDTFVRGNDGNLWQRSFRGTWSNWIVLGSPAGGLSGGPDAASWGLGHMDVVAPGPDGNVWQLTYGNGWQPWVNIASPPGGVSSDPSAVSWGPNRLDVFVRGGNDNNLWQRSHS